jgi:hypothetical protein
MGETQQKTRREHEEAKALSAREALSLISPDEEPSGRGEEPLESGDPGVENGRTTSAPDE